MTSMGDKTYFRLQKAGLSLSQMRRHRTREGIGCPSQDSAYGSFGGAWDAYDDDDGEVVVMEGAVVQQLYDGVLLVPKRILARFKKGYFRQHLDEIAAEWESWD